MQKIRLWEITPDQKLAEMTSNQIPLEERLENWLESDISVLDPNLLVIGRQVRTDYDGTIDLLCLNSAGDTVVVELKKDKTPRDVTAQALDYASWVKDLSYERLTEIADRHFGSENSLASEFQNKFGEELPEELNLNHRSLVVAEEIDPRTARIVRYLSDVGVPINAVTVQHFRDKDDRAILAQVYLIEPKEAEAKAQSRSKRAYRNTLAGLQQMAEENGIGDLYRRVRDGVRGLLYPRAYQESVAYVLRLDGGGERTVMFISATPSYETEALDFTVHATRINNHLGIALEDLKRWLPKNCWDTDLSNWIGSSTEEKKKALGFKGYFTSVDEVDKFLNGLRSSMSREQVQE